MGVQNAAFPLIGKYRDIVIAASLFVIFDLFVLVLNFYTSYEIAEDATAINLAGRQRMLSQRMTKTLLQTEMAGSEEERQRALSELAVTFNLFDSTFTAFKLGGMTQNTDKTSLNLAAVEDADAQNTLVEAESIWLPLKQNVTDLLNKPDNIMALSTAIGLANSKNLNLLKLMNDLTTRLAVMAQEKAERLRMFQSVGITLALINFGLLLFHFLRKLNRSDAAADEARKETEEILTTVNEGFFLVDEQLNLGHQHSSAMDQIFQRDITPGTPFLALLEGKVSQQTLNTAREYIELLFTKRIRENLATDLNPLVKLEIDISNDPKVQDIHYLNIGFKRVKSDNVITHLLGSVIDITEQVNLEKSLAIAEAKSKEELELLSQILQSNPLHMRDYLDSTKKFLLSINNMLEKSTHSYDYANIISQSLPAIHKIKGDASALGSDVFTSMAHEFEQTLNAASSNAEITSEELLPVTIHINTFLAKINTISEIIEKIALLVPSMAKVSVQSRGQQWVDNLKQLTEKVSVDLNKKVSLSFKQANLNDIEDVDANKIRDICIQMIRNAIAHGIELPVERQMKGKSQEGNINISLIANKAQTELVIKDDGQGLSLEKIKNSLIKNNRYTADQLAEMDAKSIIMTIFNSGVSTAEELNEHAGQGVGLSIVKQGLNDLGGRIVIASRSGQYTEFRLAFNNVRLKVREGVIAA